MATVFFSYSHKDETLRDQLEIALAAMKRQGLISTWHDRRITAGSDVDDTIDKNVESADIILLLVSPDFIASDYCYERELTRAMKRHENHEARVIPVILRPCDWHGLPFGKLLAAPTDGKPVTKWPNQDEAFLDVVEHIKRALNELGRKPEQPTIISRIAGRAASSTAARSSNLRIKKNFTELDYDNFRHEGFEYIANFFENSLAELDHRHPDLQQRFLRPDVNHFTAALYQSGQKVCKGSASIGDSFMGSNTIQYSMTDAPTSGSMNEAVYVKSDDQQLYFEPLRMQSYGREGKEKLTAQGAAELFWALFIRPLQ